MSFYTPGAIDTQLDPPVFVSSEDHQSLIESAQDAVRERDELTAEIERLRRDSEQTQQLRRQLEETRARVAKGSGVTAREVMELRESVDQRDREIRRLKDANIARERLLADAREKIDAVMHERASVE